MVLSRCPFFLLVGRGQRVVIFGHIPRPLERAQNEDDSFPLKNTTQKKERKQRGTRDGRFGSP
jgi:hypothetical protein